MKKDKEFFLHESSYLDKGVQVGKCTKIWHFSHVMSGAHIGEGCTIGQNVFVGADVEIGNNVKIQNNVSVYEGVVIEDDVFCGPSMVFTNVGSPRSAYPRDSEDYEKTIVKQGATIGANVTVTPGVNIGSYSFVGAGAVVTGDVPAHGFFYGVPARQRGWVCRCGEGLEFASGKSTCESCGREYEISGDEVSIIEDC